LINKIGQIIRKRNLQNAFLFFNEASQWRLDLSDLPDTENLQRIRRILEEKIGTVMANYEDGTDLRTPSAICLTLQPSALRSFFDSIRSAVTKLFSAFDFLRRHSDVQLMAVANLIYFIGGSTKDSPDNIATEAVRH
jgi:hypothetical protein